MNEQLSGEERQVAPHTGPTIDGAPVSYVVTAASIVLALAFVPLSIVLTSGKSFPLSQSVYPLMGWLLGPVAGAVANAVGALVGVMLAPHTTTMPVATVLGAALGGLAAGAMTVEKERRWWWLPLSLLFMGAYGLYGVRAIVQNGAAWYAVLLGSFINWSALLLFVLPTRRWIGRRLQSRDLRRLGAALFLGTWSAAGLTHLSTATVVYFFSNWPNEVWLAIAPLAPFEHLIRAFVGTVIGVGVISGLRATSLVKALHAVY
ncbi:MAG: hypothetical protein ACP5HM_06365 [Anaerolineae bacterium]